jgi:hypothetical protein
LQLWDCGVYCSPVVHTSVEEQAPTRELVDGPLEIPRLIRRESQRKDFRMIERTRVCGSCVMCVDTFRRLTIVKVLVYPYSIREGFSDAYRIVNSASALETRAGIQFCHQNSICLYCPIRRPFS